jgi:hypothetical protein
LPDRWKMGLPVHFPLNRFFAPTGWKTAIVAGAKKSETRQSGLTLRRETLRERRVDVLGVARDAHLRP